MRREFIADLEKRTIVRYKDAIVGEYGSDMIVNDAVLVEIKIARQYDNRHEAQLLNLLKATGLKERSAFSRISVDTRSSTNASFSESVSHPCSSVAEEIVNAAA
jgi:hypothetical protein